ncbi:SIR2 family protein [Rhizobium laguerreae]|uniref:SIR2 family protein n=1 Tax=Rhizobium laguerreae TaxID=1076926 RepID=UPI0013F162AE|nr:SIR2 family protein [Rhizobium laguerreae]
MHLNEAIISIREDRKAILFLGAGFAAEAINIAGETTPSSIELSKRILSKLEIDGNADLSLAIDELRNQTPNDECLNFLREQLVVDEISSTQDFILNKMPWRRVYSTNIDNIAPKFYRNRVIDANDPIDSFANGDLIQLHGSIENCSATNFFQRLKMGEQNYISGSHSTNTYIDQLQNDLFECDCCIVVGYSMGDPNLSQIFFKADQLINKCFVFSGTPGRLAAHRINLIGNNTNLKSSDLVTLYQNTPKTGETIPPLTEIDRAEYSTKDLTRIIQQNLLVFGRFDHNVARTIWNEQRNNTYVVRREISQKISEALLARSTCFMVTLGRARRLSLKKPDISARQGEQRPISLKNRYL